MSVADCHMQELLGNGVLNSYHEEGIINVDTSYNEVDANHNDIEILSVK